jgi:hypothetical protein
VGAALRGRGLLAATATGARSLPDSRLLDRLVRSRWWIPVLGVILTGVVALQVEVLKDGASVGRSINFASSLQSANQLLRLDIARLSDPQRIERIAAGLGMVIAGPTSVDFVSAGRPGAVGRAIRSIKPPDPQAFLTSLTAQAALSTPTGTTTAGGVGVPFTPTTAGSGAGLAGATPGAGGSPASGAGAGGAPIIGAGTGAGASSSAPAAGAATTTPVSSSASGAGTIPASTGVTNPAAGAASNAGAAGATTGTPSISQNQATGYTGAGGSGAQTAAAAASGGTALPPG